ncbi:MAG: glutamine-hydrolyzing carbamoyl-phosphate synthase small subunit [Clostridia bacterium]|jgi:carbamoyl-phosphate synthase small subunit|nr:glutamine-hydrolyzing carbamoyl-phosphate synthase small subunit [Clostridia bacterium]MCI9290814.1 glutamine-hydrolyzing carbamoyl-phosphate synthase small subunit [Clostridia bacterium]
MKKVYLILENGKVFEGESIGAEGEVIGEVVFTTAMTGYLETLTDPSYYGQMVCQTFPLIGNYGVMEEDFESPHSFVKGYIVRDVCDTPSNFRSQGKLDDMLKKLGVIGICGIDTRELTKIVRESGVMNAIITDKPTLDPAKKKQLDEYVIKDAVKSVSCTQKRVVCTVKKPKKRVALLDYGIKKNIIEKLARRGCEVTVFPHNTSADEIINFAPDGIMLSNGPGNPEENTYEITQIKKLVKSGIPMFGICIGHQLLALSQGAKTYKLKYGHRGGNQPVKDLESGRVYVSTQNHGYAVDNDTIPKSAKVTFVNVNDGTCEGIDYKNSNVFSVQFHPEACAGPLDTGYLFDRFMENMEERK